MFKKGEIDCNYDRSTPVINVIIYYNIYVIFITVGLSYLCCALRNLIILELYRNFMVYLTELIWLSDVSGMVIAIARYFMPTL